MILKYSDDDPGVFGFLLHDYQLGDYWNKGQKNRNGRTRWYPKTHGDPETVLTFYKEDRVNLSPAWQDFHKLMFVLAAFGEAKISLFHEVADAFDRTMGPTVVITNKKGFPTGYMPLCMGGNIVRLLNTNVYRPNAKFGESYKFECLDASKPPPDVEDVFWNKPWLWSKATVARYAHPDEDIPDLGTDEDDRWKHVIPFPKMDPWNAHVPLLNINNRDWNYVQKERVEIWDKDYVPNPYHPELTKAFI